MKFEEFGLENEKTLLLLPGTGCTWQMNFGQVMEELEKRYHLICVNYDGFDGDNSKTFSDMITVTEKIEDYVISKHGGKVDGAYGSSLGGSFVGLLIERKRIHINHGFIGSSDLDEGTPAVAWLATKIIGGAIQGAARSEKKKQKLFNMLEKGIGMEMDEETTDFLEAFVNSLLSLHPDTLKREFYSDYVTRLGKNIDVEGTTIHIIYALKMGKKYEKRYRMHFKNPDIIRFDMQHEAWLVNKEWRQPILEMIERCMGV